MAVSEDDVRRIAELARLGVDPDRLPALARQLDGILGHMAVLQGVPLDAEAEDAPEPARGAPWREDVVAPMPLARAPEDMAPAMRDGFFLVPRLASHEAPAGDAPRGDTPPDGHAG